MGRQPQMIVLGRVRVSEGVKKHMRQEWKKENEEKKKNALKIGR